MKKKLLQIVAGFMAMLIIMSSVVVATPMKAEAAEHPKVTGLYWEPDTYVGHWDAYNFPEGCLSGAYFITLYKGANAITSGYAHQPGVRDASGLDNPDAPSLDFTDLIEANGPGEYSFTVAAAADKYDYSTGEAVYVRLFEFDDTTSENSARKTVEGEKYKLNISVSPADSDCGRVTVNGHPVEGLYVESFENENIVLTAQPSAGYEFDKWTSENGATYESGSFTMPAQEISVCANFKGYAYIPNPKWDGSTFVAKWNKYEGCDGYLLNLYKDDVKVVDELYVTGANTESHDFSSIVASNGQGTYKFDIQAVCADSTKTLVATSGNQVKNVAIEISSIGFSLNKSNITTLVEGNSAATVKSELSSLNSTGSLITGLGSSVKLDSSDPIRLTSTTTVASELGDATTIQKAKDYCLCFHFVPNQSGDKFAASVTGPAGVATVIRTDDNNCYVYWPITSKSSGGSTPDPGTSVDPTGHTPSHNDETAAMQGEQNTEELQKTIEEIVAEENALTVTSFTSESAINGMPSAAKNVGASYNLSMITTTQGFANAITKIAANAKANSAKRNGAISITVYTDRPMSFTADILKSISDANTNFSYVFRYKGKLHKITMPRGSKVNLNGRKYEGPLFVGWLLGTSQVIE